ncbi:unnamed protein product, partial [Rotaria sp. Silwood1]
IRHEIDGSNGWSVSYYEKALEIMQRALSNNPPWLAAMYSNMGVTLEELERYDEAVGYAIQAAEIARASLGPDHAETEAYENQVRQLQQSLSLL